MVSRIDYVYYYLLLLAIIVSIIKTLLKNE